MRRIAGVAAWAAVLAWAALGWAFSSSGSIDGDFSYTGLTITGDGYLTGVITNTSATDYSYASFRAAGVNVHETATYWEAHIIAGEMPPGARYGFRKYLGQNPEDPPRILFKRSVATERSAPPAAKRPADDRPAARAPETEPDTWGREKRRSDSPADSRPLKISRNPDGSIVISQ